GRDRRRVAASDARYVRYARAAVPAPQQGRHVQANTPPATAGVHRSGQGNRHRRRTLRRTRQIPGPAIARASDSTRLGPLSTTILAARAESSRPTLQSLIAETVHDLLPLSLAMHDQLDYFPDGATTARGVRDIVRGR